MSHRWAALLAAIAEPVEDSDAEAFIVFSTSPSNTLGLAAPTLQTLETTIADRPFTITQSPTVLKSNRAGGSTGAAVWRITLALANWLASPKCALLQGYSETGLGPDDVVVELGCGVAAVLANVLAPRVRTYFATDQDYVLRLFRENYAANAVEWTESTPQRRKARREADVRAVPLDWERDDPKGINDGAGVDAVLVSDCVFNENLLAPLVQTCEDLCGVRSGSGRPTLCIVAQQLRSFEVFEMWVTMMMTRFNLWRVNRDGLGMLGEEGFVLHLAVLKEDCP